jgi:hypothetical protein
MKTLTKRLTESNLEETDASAGRGCLHGLALAGLAWAVIIGALWAVLK